MLQFRASLTLLALASLCACGGINGRSSLPIAPPAGMENVHPNTKVKYNLLHSFSKGSNGYIPYCDLVSVDGTFYGTTTSGGAYGKGTVFSVAASGTEHVLHSFGKGTDGVLPEAGLVNLNGVLYGTTVLGGRYARGSFGGTVFSITTSGKEKVLDNFGRRYTPENPYAALINLNGILYGTSSSGGQDGSGTVFSVTPAGKLQILHSFDRIDGDFPDARLVAVKGALYGTTEAGGTSGPGTIFSITPTGVFKNLYTFGAGLDKANFPYAGLTELKGMLYGTTVYGGKANAGVVFAITTKGKATLLHSFTRQHDGQYPFGNLLALNGVLYGTTRCGGSYSSDCRASGGPSLGGTVFSITPASKETVVYSFGGKPGESLTPQTGLIAVHNTLFGTTLGGGAYGVGTVYSLQLTP